MPFDTLRRGLLAGLAALAVPAFAQVGDFPGHGLELVVPFQPGGGTDALARAFADASHKHIPQSIVVVNRPGASGAIGWADVINAKPDGYKLAVVTVELTILPHMGLMKTTHEDFALIARLNADQAAITVKADAPYNTIEEFLAAAKKALAVMADQRVKGFEKVPTMKERSIDLTIGTWRGLAAPKSTPPEVLAYLRGVAAKTAREPSLREAMDKLNLGYAYADDAAFRATMVKDSAYFQQLITKLNIKN